MTADHPTATTTPPPKNPLALLIPLIAALLVGWLFYSYKQEQGHPVTITFPEGHGLKPGDAIKYRGIQVGIVDRIALAQDLGSITVHARLNPESKHIARAQSRFWIVRAQFDITRTSGLETLVGANYITVLPGDGQRQSHFDGLDTPPYRDFLDPDGLTIELAAANAKGLRIGAPVTFRNVTVGEIIDIDLADNGSNAQIWAHLNPEHKKLARTRTVFWASGGAEMKATLLDGLKFNVNSVESLIVGGIALALPRDPGGAIPEGHIYRLHAEADDDWLEWLDDRYPVPPLNATTSL